MPIITITADYDGYARFNAGYYKTDIAVNLQIGLGIVKGTNYYHRSFIRFPLSSLPAGVNVTQVRLKVYCYVAGGAAHLLDIHAYDTNGQSNPQPDNAQTAYNRCASGNLYINDSDALRTINTKWFTLGDGENAQACIDVENAKSAVNQFSVGLHEEGDNDARAYLHALEYTGGIPAQLEITYEEAAPPPAGYSYNDGLVCVRVG